MKLKIQQKAILEHGLTYDYMQEGLSLEKAQSVLNKKKEQRIENIIFLKKSIPMVKPLYSSFKNIFYQMLFIY